MPDELGRVVLIYTVVEKDFKKVPFCGKIVFEFGIGEVWKNHRELERITHMPQLQFPIFPEGVTNITRELAFMKKEGRVTYFNGQMPVFIHEEGDLRTFRMITSQFIINGNVKQAQIARVFGLPLVTVKRYTKLYREKGPAGFYGERRGRGAAVLTPEVLAKAQAMFDEGLGVSEVSSGLALRGNTLAKAVRAGRLREPLKKSNVGIARLQTDK